MGKKKKGWISGLCFSDTELLGISEGRGGEAFCYTYRRDQPSKRQRKGAHKEFIKRMKRRAGKTEPGFNIPYGSLP